MWHRSQSKNWLTNREYSNEEDCVLWSFESFDKKRVFFCFESRISRAKRDLIISTRSCVHEIETRKNNRSQSNKQLYSIEIEIEKKRKSSKKHLKHFLEKNWEWLERDFLREKTKKNCLLFVANKKASAGEISWTKSPYKFNPSKTNDL